MEKFGKFVERCGAQKTPKAGETFRITAVTLLHRTEFDDAKRLAPESCAFLQEEYWPALHQQYGERRQQPDGGQKHRSAGFEPVGKQVPAESFVGDPEDDSDRGQGQKPDNGRNGKADGAA